MKCETIDRKRYVDPLEAWELLKNSTRPPSGLRRPDAIAAPVPVRQLAKADDEFIVRMESGSASALDISRAAMHLASRRVAYAAVAGSLGMSELDDLKKTLQELRQAEADYIALGEAQARLIDRGIAMQIVGGMAGRLVRCFSLLENTLVGQIEIWLADPSIKALPTDDRRRQIREYIARAGHEIRSQEADDVDALIDQGIKDDQAENAPTE